MKIFVKTLSGQTFPIQIDGEDTVRTLKSRVYEEFGAHPDQQRLVFGGIN